MQKQPINQSINQKHTEHILVVKRDLLLPQNFHGLKKVDFASYLTIIQNHKEFLPRWQMETDPTYKQIIPYLVFEHENSYFLMQRKATASETRLQNKYTLGIGGHIRREDMLDGTTIFDWAKREFHEEVYYSGNLTIEPLGILNDDTNDVGKVHVGFVFLLKGDSSEICVKSELKGGQLLTRDELSSYFSAMESWSQFIVEHL
jgi:predicted NUDIX family phosphoesterase